MKISKIKPILAAAHEADDSVLMEGLHGIGKSEIVKQYCDENDYHYTALFLSHQEVGDLIGIPVTEIINNESVTLWSKPIWLQRMERAAWPDVEIEDLEFKDPEFEKFVRENIK